MPRVTLFGGVGMRAAITAILATALLGNVPALTAQRTPHTRPQRRWEISFTSGGSSGGSAPSIATAMVAAGLNNTLPAGCFIFWRSEEHTSELQSRTLISYAVFCSKKNKTTAATRCHSLTIQKPNGLEL